MPKIDDFPPVAVKQYREKEAEITSGIAPQATKPPGFFEKLVNAGLGRRAPEPKPAEKLNDPAFANPAAPQASAPVQNTPSHEMPPRQAAVAPTQQSSAPQKDSDFDAEQLEIPAFLRRQAN